MALKWQLFFSVFMTAANRENGTLGIDPLDAISYPAITYSVLVHIQSLFIKHIKEEQDKAAAKARRK